MEKQSQLQSHVGRKRHKKATLIETVSEPKNIKPDLLDTLTRLYLVKSPLSKSKKSKLKHTAKKIITPENPKPDTKEKMAKDKISKVKPTTIETVEAKKQKIVKPIDAVAIQPEDPGEVVTTPKKKRKKSKETISEVKDLQKNIINTANIEDKNLFQLESKFPVLGDKQLIDRFLKVPLNNNQKGRIRQAIKLSLQDTSKKLFPDIINGKIQAILRGSEELTDSDLRRVRILHNMLKTAIEAPDKLELEESPVKKKNKNKPNKSKEGSSEDADKKKTTKKIKGPKRYVVFLGNLPLDINKEKIMNHFRELNEHIKDIRLPKVAENTKSAIAYMELSNEPSYELALSKHHSMMGTKRIKVLYTTQQNSKISKSEAKGKSAKLIALQKAGRLVGSIPTAKKRSHRRAIMKKALANQASVTA